MDAPEFLTVDAGTVRAFLLGDLVAIALFVLAGEFEHAAPFSDLAYVADTAAPFYLGWLLVAPIAGAYAARARESYGNALLATAPAWLLADLAAMALRATTLFHGDAAVTLYLVAGVVGLGLLSAWRLAAIAVR